MHLEKTDERHIMIVKNIGDFYTKHVNVKDHMEDVLTIHYTSLKYLILATKNGGDSEANDACLWLSNNQDARFFRRLFL